MRKLYMNGRYCKPVPAPVKSLFFLLFTWLLLPAAAFTQTNPTAQTLPYTQNFDAFTGSTTTYPAGMQGWAIAGSTAAAYPTAAPSGDQVLAGATNASSSAFVGDMNGKIGFLCTGAVLRSVALAINTSSTTAISVSYLAATQRQQATARVGAIGLQYRVGTSGVFTDVAGSEYQDPGGTDNITGTGSISPQTITVTLPVACENQPIVQLRWVYREVSGSGNRPGFSIDNIAITGTAATSSPAISVSAASLSGFTTTVGTASASQAVNVGGTNLTTDITVSTAAPYELSANGSGYST
ncbi:MAG TPA: hypothetical protein VLD19_16430, partial [Chitinophagaceae bacterium]|nr:hypothetical protein [Chitinophagaceae bacterium]